MGDYKDLILKCIECGIEFIFTVEEQEYYEKKGFTSPPKRCKECREIRKTRLKKTNGTGKNKNWVTSYNKEKQYIYRSPAFRHLELPSYSNVKYKRRGITNPWGPVCAHCGRPIEVKVEPGKIVYCEECSEQRRVALKMLQEERGGLEVTQQELEKVEQVNNDEILEEVPSKPNK